MAPAAAREPAPGRREGPGGSTAVAGTPAQALRSAVRPRVPIASVPSTPGRAAGRSAGRCGPVGRRQAPTAPSAQSGQGRRRIRPAAFRGRGGGMSWPWPAREARWRAGRSAAVRLAEAGRAVPCGRGRSRGAGTCGRARAGPVGRGRPRAALCRLRRTSPHGMTRDRGRAGGGYRCAALCGRSGGTLQQDARDRLRPGRALTGPAAGVQLRGPFPALPSWSCPAGCRCRPSYRPGPGEHGYGQRARLHGAGGAYHERQQKR